MSKNTLIILIVGIVLGSLLTAILLSPNRLLNDNHMTSEDESSDLMSGKHGMNMSMNEMSEALESLKGDNFDKAFLEMMIDHHQGAIDMANLAKNNAVHKEVIALSDEILKAQTSEIKKMREWQNSWGYSLVTSSTSLKWEDSKSFFNDCRVKMTAELHSGELQLTLIDDTIKRIKPYNKIELQSLTEEANNKCPTQIIIAME